ncbi:class I SAM-dependent methyltransferase [Agrobacterium sp. a22-2]|uniref:class I SAM-dependent methyltransferase n=1 Tax=Agrobacterium sp. a22-2 TaxID=2283840 RepID=UPI0014463344|nr:class I SAM-dependent methyltransferase [Agrobacterium sp. a22-2]NKN35181.1 class I SAM-dependent methyltransferase [Agrobacterium sp. a22-2]
MSEALRYSHAGWETYYLEHRDERAWGGVPDGFLMEHIDEVLVSGASNVLDVASGDGRNSEPFLERGLNVVSADLSPAALSTFAKRCQALGERKPCLVAGDFLSIGFIPEQFDAIVCFNSIPHFESPSQALYKIADLLRAGGRAAFNAFTPGDVAFGQGEKVGANKYYYRDTLFTFMTEDDLKSILPLSVAVVHSETRKWQEPDHGTYRRGTHTHEACFFIIEKKVGYVG